MVDALDKFILSTWRSCARQLYATFDPVRFISKGAPGIVAGAPAGLSDQVEAENTLARTVDTPPLAQQTSWFMSQRDALITQPHFKAEVLNSDENQPARVWREGRAKVAGAMQGVHLYPKGQHRNRVAKLKASK